MAAGAAEAAVRLARDSEDPERGGAVGLILCLFEVPTEEIVAALPAEEIVAAQQAEETVAALLAAGVVDPACQPERGEAL